MDNDLKEGGVLPNPSAATARSTIVLSDWMRTARDEADGSVSTSHRARPRRGVR